MVAGSARFLRLLSEGMLLRIYGYLVMLRKVTNSLSNDLAFHCKAFEELLSTVSLLSSSLQTGKAEVLLLALEDQRAVGCAWRTWTCLEHS